MAIDTAAKRASAIGVGQCWDCFIIPDGSVDQGDRQTLSGLYGGILATTVGEFVRTIQLTGLYSTTVTLNGLYDKTVGLSGLYSKIIRFTSE